MLGIRHQSDPAVAVASSDRDTGQQVLRFPGTALQVVLENAAPVADALAAAVKGWAPDHQNRPDPSLRTSSVLGVDAVFAASSSYLGETIHGLGVAGAACAVIADLAEDFFVTRPGCLALHGAAFAFHDRLIAMTGPSRAGKSTLAARLTQETDMAVFCDDVLPLLPDGNAVGLGIAPRLRLPLPDTASATFRAHVARYLGPRDDRYGYLCSPNVAPHDTRMPLSVLLILDRRPQGKSALHHVAADEALHYLLAQNMADLQSAEHAYDQLTNLLGQITCLRLVYSDLEQAVALIRHAFGGQAVPAPDVVIGPAVAKAPSKCLPQTDLPADIRWSRRPDVTLQTKADAAFLWLPGRQVIWHMNALALAVWTLLEIPGSARDIGQVLAEHFPDQDAASLTDDVNALLQALAKNDLIDSIG